MIETKRCFGAMVTAPHDLAARAGLRVLDENGTCLEAMVAAAATIAVTYPHMNGLGGDNFWLISVPGERAKGIDACGAGNQTSVPLSGDIIRRPATFHKIACELRGLLDTALPCSSYQLSRT